mmetsp:Transcript_57563/g.137082  ORF Transcript_57563/g.137082 Transcript_57563/m.137082 type:complete len:392 (+) Transcript_57563:1681-2856(+)
MHLLHQLLKLLLGAAGHRLPQQDQVQAAHPRRVVLLVQNFQVPGEESPQRRQVRAHLAEPLPHRHGAAHGHAGMPELPLGLEAPRSNSHADGGVLRHPEGAVAAPHQDLQGLALQSLVLQQVRQQIAARRVRRPGGHLVGLGPAQAQLQCLQALLPGLRRHVLTQPPRRQQHGGVHGGRGGQLRKLRQQVRKLVPVALLPYRLPELLRLRPIQVPVLSVAPLRLLRHGLQALKALEDGSHQLAPPLHLRVGPQEAGRIRLRLDDSGHRQVLAEAVAVGLREGPLHHQVPLQGLQGVLQLLPELLLGAQDLLGQGFRGAPRREAVQRQQRPAAGALGHLGGRSTEPEVPLEQLQLWGGPGVVQLQLRQLLPRLHDGPRTLEMAHLAAGASLQ